MALRIQMPERIRDEFGDGIFKLMRILDQINLSNSQTIIFDFKYSKFLNPFFLCGIACCIKSYESAGKEIIIENNGNSSIISYLDTISFPNCFESKLGEEENFVNFLNQYKGKTYFPLVAFSVGSDIGTSLIRDKALTVLSNIIKEQLKIKDKEIMPISYLIDEACNNINDHSESRKGLIFAQYYPSNNYLDLCISDFGKGIYNSYLKSDTHNPENEREAVEFAINGKSTKESSTSRGFGITTSRKMLTKGLRGKYFLWTGNVNYLENYESQSIVDLPKSTNFPGTFVAMRIPTILNEKFDFCGFLES